MAIQSTGVGLRYAAVLDSVIKMTQLEMQWYNANTGEPIDMSLPSIVAFRAGASMTEVMALAALEPKSRQDGRKRKPDRCGCAIGLEWRLPHCG